VATLVDAVTYTTSVATGRRVGTRTTQVIQQGSNGLSTSTQVTSTFVAGRLSWRQINNYQDLRNAP
jgi:type IV pilus assembly protein PilY1